MSLWTVLRYKFRSLEMLKPIKFKTMLINKEISFETVVMLIDVDLYKRIKLYKDGIFEIPKTAIIRVYKNSRFFPTCPEQYEIVNPYAYVEVIVNNYDIITNSFSIDGEEYNYDENLKTVTPIDKLFKKIE